MDRRRRMRTQVTGALVVLPLLLLIGTSAKGGSLSGCCGCTCLSQETGSVDICLDVFSIGTTECASICANMDSLDCTQSFFQENTMCSDPSLALSCGSGDETMAPVVSSQGMATLAVIFLAMGASYLRRRPSDVTEDSHRT